MEWHTIIVVVVSWVFCAGVNYGIFKTQVHGLEQRITKLEDEKYLTRIEYESRHRELMELVHRARLNN